MPYTIPEYIEVKTATGNTVAFLSPESDGVVAWIDDEQNGSCTIEIELPLSEKVVEYEQVQIGEGEEIVGWEYSEDITSGKTYSADSSLDEYGFIPDNAFDDDASTYWHSVSEGDFPRWIQVDLGDDNAKIVQKMRLKPFYGYVKNFKLQGSNDGIAWIDVFTGIVEKNENWHEFVFDNLVAYRYYRIYVEDNHHGSTYSVIYEIELMEIIPIYEPIYEQRPIYKHIPYPKWQYLTDKYRIYADGKEFVINNADAVDRQRDGKKLTGKVKAHESWVLLGKKYQTISNDPQNTSPPWGAVIIVSGGSDLSGGRYSVGSAGHALYALLQGTGWTVGTVDVPGTYDLETEKESVLANINQMQEKWGGILVWDSLNHTVSLRDEATWQNYTGYQIRYAKNLKGINRVDDYDIVTRLFPFGENDLNIATVNGGLLYLDNQSYSTEVLEGVWYNQDIADQAQLKIQGEKQLAVMCKPRHNYKTEVLDLRSLLGYGHETFTRSDMVDLFDEEFGANARVRIIRYRHNVFQPWLCDMELGDPLEKIAASVAQSVLMAKFYKNVVMPNTSFQNLMKAIINTEATEINGANGDFAVVDGVATWSERIDGVLTGNLVRITPLGIIISSNGGQTWDLAINGGGVNASAVRTGTLNAGVVTIGADTTFEEGYDPTKITANSVGMGVDSDCVGLFHFDGSLNSHKGVAADSDGTFDTGCFGQALRIATGKHLKVTGPGAEGTVTFRAKNLAASPNGSVLVDVPQSDNSQGIRAGIASDGRLYAQDLPLLFNYAETTQADFQTGTLVDVTATSAGDLELVSGKTVGSREKVIDLSQVPAVLSSAMAWDKTDAIQAGTFSRASVAYLADGTEVASGVPRFEPVKFGQGLFAEKGTINILSTNQSSVETDTTGFTSGYNTNPGATITRTTTEHYHGASALKVDCTANGHGFDVTLVECTAGNPYTAFVRVKAPVGQSMRMRIAFFDYPITRETGATYTDFVGTGAWQEVAVTMVAPVDSARVCFGVSSRTATTFTFYADCMMISPTDFVPSWVLGGVTRADEHLTIPSTGVIDTQRGTIAIWQKMGKASTPAPSGVHDNIFSLDAGVWAVCQSNGATDRLAFVIGDTWGTSRNAICNIAWDKDDLLFIVPKWDLPNISLTVYNFTKGTSATASIAEVAYTSSPTLAYVNCGAGSFLGYTNSLVDELRIDKVARTDEEIAGWYASDAPAVADEYTTFLANFDNTLNAITGTVKVEAALSTDGGATYGTYQKCTSGQAIPGVTAGIETANVKLKLRESLNTYGSTTPQLHSLNLSITEKEAETAYGPNKSTLTAWDAISLAWKVDRLSLVVNDTEACYIENPGLPATFGSYIFIGSDRNSANAINTLVDELRLDKVYKDAAIRTAWYKTGTPFYTSEDMKQWPGYLKAESDGIKVYDSSNVLRVLLGSWLESAVRKYGIKIIGGEIYSTVIQSGEEGATSYIRLGDIWEPLEVVENGKRALNIWSSGGGMLQFYDTNLNDMAGQITPVNDADGQGLEIRARSNSGSINKDLILRGRFVRINGYPPYSDQWSIYLDGHTFVTGNLFVQGSIQKTDGLNYVEPTKNYGTRLLNAVEAPEFKYYDSGRATLINGEAIVYLDPIYLEVIEPDTDLTPWLFKTEVYGEGEDIRVIEWGDDYFKVKECNGGTSNRKFGWWFEATRINYAGIRLMEVINHG